MSHMFEAMMVISFGISWPTSILKSYTSRTAKGKSIKYWQLFFNCDLNHINSIINKVEYEWN